MNLIVGLGNPGLKYRNTRHNIGFLIIKELSEKFRIPLKKKIYGGIMGKGTMAGKKTALFIPQTYMNLSGQAVFTALKKEKVPLENLLVIYDDVDLKFGSIRIREKGSAGGHKGLLSIIGALETSDFPRLRVGIGKDEKVEGMTEFVLSTFDRDEKVGLKKIMARATECALLWAREGAPKAMALFNRPDRSAT